MLSIALAYNKPRRAVSPWRLPAAFFNRSEREAPNGIWPRAVACWTPSPIKEAIMSDNLHNRGPQDRSRINLHEKWEVQYWTKELGVTQEQLEQAVKQAGNSVNAVREHLSGTRH
jgi:hypothetical protein